MRKENVLVVALVVIALSGIYLFNQMNNDMPDQAAVDIPAPAVAAQNNTLQANSSGITWKDYTPGMALAKKEDKSIFLYFHAQWCTYCTKLKKTTFKDPDVMAYLNDNFVSIQVDTDKNKKLAQQWRVKGLPTLWFLEPSGKKINNMPGYVDAGQLLQILKYVHTKSYNTMEFHEFVKQG